MSGQSMKEWLLNSYDIRFLKRACKAHHETLNSLFFYMVSYILTLVLVQVQTMK